MVAHSNVADNAAADSRAREQPQNHEAPQRHREALPDLQNHEAPQRHREALPDLQNHEAPQQHREALPDLQNHEAPQQHREALPDQNRFPIFQSYQDFRTITETTTLLERSGFYWGPLSVEEAHTKLKAEPLGTFLIRDSSQKNHFFTLSLKMPLGATSVRINFKSSRFSLVGSKESFDCLFKLLEYYMCCPKKSLGKPLRKEKLQPLQELCRKRIIQTFGRENVDSIPVNAVLKDFLSSFPFRL
ncbi:suppressor of cytokine signaling 1 [Acipenser oxyrinchus oxyrinchus]|uniref:Suppressor of cytokine signaling 1 n=1 Tax=Acipenser oxyrinchus oxyrinchus TaxID=40147 RepID=A0AAD8D3L5_ACIOX|nr:suppressor of cytokine signaling 1 [Acipenser oxyrinchus oxyrinchus]